MEMDTLYPEVELGFGRIVKNLSGYPNRLNLRYDRKRSSWNVHCSRRG